MNDINLPPGWAWTTLDALGRWYGGGTPSKKESSYWVEGLIPWLSPKDMGADVLSSTQDHITEAAVAGSSVKVVPADSVAIVVRSGILERTVPVALVPFATTLNQDMKAIKPHDGVSARWLAHVLRARESVILGSCRRDGTTVASLATDAFQKLPIALPPEAEQDRISCELERRLSHLEATERTLQRSLRLVDVARRSVLEAVAGGSLLSCCTSSWEKLSTGDVATVGGGIQKQPKRKPVRNKYPFLRVANVARGRLDLAEVHEIELFGSELETYRLRKGDLLVVEGNGSIDQIGRAASWDGSIEDCVHQNHLIRVRPGDRILPSFLALVWNAPSTVEQLKAVASSTSGLHTLSAGKVRSVRLLVPPMETQAELVREAERRLSILDAVADNVERQRRACGTVRSSVLAHAFRGDLVQQDPTDEPAEALLRRIQDERDAATHRMPRAGRRPLRKKEVSE